jgi:hypothetical protein
MIICSLILVRNLNISDKICIRSNHAFCIQKTFFRKSCFLWDHAGKFGTDRQTTDDYNTAQGLCVWMTKATSTHSEYIIVTALYYNNGYSNAPHCYVTRHLPVVSLWQYYFLVNKLLYLAVIQPLMTLLNTKPIKFLQIFPVTSLCCYGLHSFVVQIWSAVKNRLWRCWWCNGKRKHHSWYLFPLRLALKDFRPLTVSVARSSFWRR